MMYRPDTGRDGLHLSRAGYRDNVPATETNPAIWSATSHASRCGEHRAVRQDRTA